MKLIDRSSQAAAEKKQDEAHKYSVERHIWEYSKKPAKKAKN